MNISYVSDTRDLAPFKFTVTGHSYSVHPEVPWLYLHRAAALSMSQSEIDSELAKYGWHFVTAIGSDLTPDQQVAVAEVLPLVVAEYRKLSDRHYKYLKFSYIDGKFVSNIQCPGPQLTLDATQYINLVPSKQLFGQQLQCFRELVKIVPVGKHYTFYATSIQILDSVITAYNSLINVGAVSDGEESKGDEKSDGGKNGQYTNSNNNSASKNLVYIDSRKPQYLDAIVAWHCVPVRVIEGLVVTDCYECVLTPKQIETWVRAKTVTFKISVLESTKFIDSYWDLVSRNDYLTMDANITIWTTPTGKSKLQVVLFDYDDYLYLTGTMVTFVKYRSYPDLPDYQAYLLVKYGYQSPYKYVVL